MDTSELLTHLATAIDSETTRIEGKLQRITKDTNKEASERLSGNWRNYNTITPDVQPNIERCGWITRNSKNQCGSNNNLLITIVGAVLQLGATWLLLYCFFKNEVYPDGGLFKVITLTLTSYFVGQIVTIFRLPALLGMLITGIAFRTSGFYHISGSYPEIVIVLREAALATILIRAGLGLDADALLKLSFVVLRLALLPCLGESFAVAAASHYILGFSWMWGLLLGFLLSAVSPAVVVPSLLSLKERGYGEDKGISTLVIGASSLDDITAISVFGVFLGIIFIQGDLSQQLIQGPKELVLGLVTGTLWGILSSIFPNINDSTVVFKRCTMIGIWGLLAVIGSQMIDYPGAGPLSCIAASLTAGIFWKLQGWPNQNPVSEIFGVIWRIMEPVLFGLIGAEIDLLQLRMDTIGYGILVVLFGLVFRVIVCFIAVQGTNLNIKEKLFVNLSWIPKATVQAALASKALDIVHGQDSPKEEDIDRSTQVLTIAVLSILITAPLGAIGVAIGGPVLLSQTQHVEKNCDETEASKV